MPEFGRPSRYPEPFSVEAPLTVPGYPMLMEHPSGTVILILGIVGLVFPLTAPVAWVMGSSARKDIRRHGRVYSNESALLIGQILGILVTVGWLIGLLILVVSMTIGWAFIAGW